jgi:hypothetical protein
LKGIELVPYFKGTGTLLDAGGILPGKICSKPQANSAKSAESA